MRGIDERCADGQSREGYGEGFSVLSFLAQGLGDKKDKFVKMRSD